MPGARVFICMCMLGGDNQQISGISTGDVGLSGTVGIATSDSLLEAAVSCPDLQLCKTSGSELQIMHNCKSTALFERQQD